MTTKKYHSLILNHYKKLAKNYGAHQNSSMRDKVIRRAEVDFILGEVKNWATKKRKKKFTIFEAGCGNGHLLSCLSQNFPSAKLYGLEFTPELCQIAQERNLPSTILKNGDLCQENFFDEMKSCDIAITERVIINILERPDQYIAVENIASKLKKGGLYIMVESFRMPLVRLNMAREEMSLPPIAVPVYNRYLSDTFVDKAIEKYGFKRLEGQRPAQYLSTHFYLTRVLNDVIRKQTNGRALNHFIFFLEEALPKGVGSYSPIEFRVYQKL